MPDWKKLESILIADIGRVTTKVALVDHVSDRFRFVAAGVSATTAAAPDVDVAIGIRNAIHQIEARTERVFLGNDGQLILPERPGVEGVDAFTAVTSAPQPLRVAIAGLSREVSLAAAVRAINGTHATVVATLALDETGGRWLPARNRSNDHAEDKSDGPALLDPAVTAAEALARSNPEVILLVGGIDGGATTALYDITNLIATIIAACEEGQRPVVVFAGNSAARSQIANRIGQLTQLRVVDNLCPTLEQENLAPLQHDLETLYAEKKILWLPGLNALSSWLPGQQVIPSTRAFQNVVRYLGRRYGLGVLGADIGSAATTIVSSRGENYARVVRADLGIGQNLERVIQMAGLERLMDWLPSEMSSNDALVHYLNQALRPQSLPTTREESYLSLAAAHAALAVSAQDLNTASHDLIVLSGGLCAHNSNFGALALLALDTLQPCGIFSLAVDTLGIAPALGGLAQLNTEAAASVIENDGFVTLGTVIAPISENREGQIDLRVQIQSAKGGAINLDVAHGSLELIPLEAGQKATIEIRPADRVEMPQTRHGLYKAEIEGGALGLMIDARGRPIALPTDKEKRRAKVQQWYWDLGSEVANG
jgi:hypothetical protein